MNIKLKSSLYTAATVICVIVLYITIVRYPQVLALFGGIIFAYFGIKILYDAIYEVVDENERMKKEKEKYE